MREGVPSFTAAGVAVARSFLDRPSTPTGDPDAEARLVEALVGRVNDERVAARVDLGDFFDYVQARTRFFDDAVTDAVNAGVGQVVILGAGYDGRALRFRTPGTQFFEVDHPSTQHDKRQLLDEVGASTQGVTFVAADFTRPDWADCLTGGGFDHTARSLFVCEGLLRYLPEHAFRDLLRLSAQHAAPDSVLAASISTRNPDNSQPDLPIREREQSLEQAGEAVLTVPTREVALRWLAEAGWNETTVKDVADSVSVRRRGRLLVRARRQ